MIAKNPMQLKALIKKKASENNVTAQSVLQNYMLERLLERISLSPYKNSFILKGGFLISAVVGIDARTTMDLDTTLKGLPLTEDVMNHIFTQICSMRIEDDVSFRVIGISKIRKQDDYAGFRVSLSADCPPISVPLSVDVTTGDVITPREIDYEISLLFEDRKIRVLTYNLETLLAEKIETVLSRNIANTRLRDYYDIHILYITHWKECDKKTLRSALERTAQKRRSTYILKDHSSILNEIRRSVQLNQRWEKYRNEFLYAKDISFEDVCHSIRSILLTIDI